MLFVWCGSVKISTRILSQEILQIIKELFENVFAQFWIRRSLLHSFETFGFFKNKNFELHCGVCVCVVCACVCVCVWGEHVCVGVLVCV